jgi:catabolite regulation protein CreA
MEKIMSVLVAAGARPLGVWYGFARRSCLCQHDVQSALAERQGCVGDFDDPKVPGVTCFISRARKGGWGQPLGLNEDPSNLSVACRQTGPITTDISELPEREEAFSEKTSIFFKKTRIYRIPDAKRNILVYLAVSLEDHRGLASERGQRGAGHAVAEIASA